MPTVEKGMGEEDWGRDMQLALLEETLEGAETYVRQDGRTIQCVGFTALYDSLAPQHRN